MGTEVKIGIGAGLLIVVVCWVYFVYGSSRDGDDLRIVTGTTAATAPQIPAGRETRPVAARSSGPSVPARPTNTATPSTASPSPASTAAMTPANRPGMTGPYAAANPHADGSTGSIGASSDRVLTPIHGAPSTGSPGARTPTAGGNSRFPNPAEPVVSTPLRTGASPSLIEATRRNLESTNSGATGSAASMENGRPTPANGALTNATGTPASASPQPTGGAPSIVLPNSLKPSIPVAASSNTVNTPSAGAAHSGAANSATVTPASQTGSKPANTSGTLVMNLPSRSTPVVRSPANSGPIVPDSNTNSIMKPTPLANSASILASSPRADSAISNRTSATGPTQHTIASGDTLSTISIKYYGSSKHVPLIMKSNSSLNPKRLKIGDVVTIPRLETVPEPTTVNAPIGAADATAKSSPPAGSSVANSNGSATGPSRTYVVREGDTLYNIAQRMLGDGKKWKSIFEKNRGVMKNDPKRLSIGMVLNLPS